MNQHLQTILNIIQQDESLSAEEKKAIAKSLKDADKELEITAFKLDRTEKVKRTTAILLEETITELEQKRKAVEAQNRELEIESGLERVRAQAMGMKKPDDILEICKVMFTELSSLGFPGLRNAMVNFWDDEHKTLIDYDYSHFTGAHISRFSYRNHPAFQQFQNEIRRSKDAFTEIIISNAELQSWKQRRQVDGAYDDPRLENISALYYYFYSIGIGAVGISTFNPLPVEMQYVLKRFRNVFDLAYRRYLDITTAEAQAREAKVEAALERVRAAAMAMHKSDDLHAAVKIMFEEFQKLNLDVLRCGVGILNTDSRTGTVWATSVSENGLAVQISANESFDTHPLMMRIYEFWQKQEDLAYVLQGQDLIAYYKAMDEGELKLPKSQLPFLEDELKPQYYYTAMFNAGGLYAFRDKSFTAEDIKLMKRFANVLNLTYNRFLDLQKAEAQAREAQIEAALERVRAAAMAMHKSEDLNDAAGVVFEELDKLNLGMLRCGIGVINGEKRTVDVWSTSVTDHGNTVQVSGDESMDNHPLLQGAYDAWIRQEDFSYLLQGEDLITYYKAVEKTNIKLPELQKITAEGSRQFYYVATFQAGGLYAYREREFSTEAKAVMKRFANVFDLTYKRFLDLQKAEAQAREAQIELGLERVRARAMAMQNSEELKELIGTVFTELTKLDLVLTRCVIMIYNSDANTSRWWMANSEDPENPNGFYIKQHQHPPIVAYFKGWRERQLKWTYVLEGQVKKDWDVFLFNETELKLLPDFVIEGMKAPGKVYLNASFNNFGNLTLATLEPLSDEHFDILLRFAKVFDLTYTRFNDLQKAEAQAREAKIQLAMERVRARTMAMQKSEELGDISFELVKQVQSLGVATWHCAFNIYDEDQNSSTEWGSNAGGTYPTYKTPREGVFLRYYEIGQTGETLHIEVIGEDKCADHYAWLCTLPGVGDQLLKLRDSGVSFPTSQIDHVAYFKYGYLLFITYEPAPEAYDIFKRFAKVFEQTYTRFLDLQKAEGQAREAQIELALERVRARAMAMQKSDELSEAAQLLYHEFGTLGINTFTCGYQFIKEEKNTQTAWVVLPNGRLLPNFIDFPLTGDHVLDNRYKAWKEKLPLHVFEIYGEANKEHHRFLSNHVPPFVIQDIFSRIPDRIIFYCANFSDGYLFIIASESLSPDEEQIIIRFAKVFEMTYTRFLDLQKAEGQAREAKIEAALERVRVRTMAMQKSDELSETAAVLFQQFKQLGEDPLQIAIGTFNEAEGTVEARITDWSDMGSEVYRSFILSVEEPALISKEFNAWKEGKSSIVVDLTGKELENWIRYRNKIYGIPVRAEDIAGRRVVTCAFFSRGTLSISTPEPPSLETIQLLERFAKVFNLTYNRFLDLQKAEAQARESQIELGLERVRARAMSMQTSEELNALIGTVFTELTKLDLTLIGSVIMIFNSETNASRWWMVNSEAPSEPLSFFIKYHKHPPYLEFIEAWKERKLKWQYELKGNIKKEWDDFLFTETELAFIPAPVIAGMRTPERILLSTSFNNFGCLNVGTLEPLTDEQFDILLRFAKVFDLTYTRFNDLKQAEAQAREAKIEASLERVRSKAMAMHSSKDLADTIVAFYHELETFSITPRRCGVGLLNKETRIAELSTMNTTEEGESIEIIGKIKMAGHKVLEGVFANWLKQKEYHPVLQGSEIKDYYQLLKPQIEFPDYPNDVIQYGYFFFFPEGGVYAWTDKMMAEEELIIYRRFTSVLSLTYKRYKDLQQAEELALQAEQDLITLKAEKKKTEDALSELKATQTQLIQSEKMASLGELTAGIAHEIQNPLNFVNNFSEVNKELLLEMKEEMKKGNLHDAAVIANDVIENEEKINHHGKRADAIVKGMLQHSRSSSGIKEPTDINKLVDEYFRLAYHGLRAKNKSFNATLKTDFDERIDIIEIIPQDVGRVILNLITNAFYAVTEKKKQHPDNYEPTVLVSTKKTGDKVLISVKDNGNGIPKKVLDKIFQPFFTTKPTGQGTGLGLSLSYDIIKAHGGEIKVETKEGGGTEFIINLGLKEIHV